MKLFVSLILAFASFSTNACRVSVLGDEIKLNKASSVFEGVIVGVQLDYLKKALKDSDKEFPITFIGGGSLEHTVSVFVTHVHKGNIKKSTIIEANAGGCGVVEAKLKKTGVFYFYSDDSYIIPKYSDENN